MKRPLSWVLFLIALVTGALLSSGYQEPYLHLQSSATIVTMVLLMSWVIVSTLERRGSDNNHINFILIVATSLAIITGLLITQLFTRIDTGNRRGIHDGAVQAEVAATFLIQGNNPYDANYQNTPFGIFQGVYGSDHPNPAWQHFAYPPLILLLAVPGAIIEHITDLPADVRIVYVLVFVVLCGMFIKTQSKWSSRALLAAATLANPLLWIFPLAGFNDVVAVAGILGAVVAWRSGRGWLAGISFGAALAAKQTTWFILPLWLLWLWFQPSTSSRIAFRRAAASTALTVGLLFLPWILWNPGALWDDLVRYVGGGTQYPGPIVGPTLQQFIVWWRLVPSVWSVTPTTIVQLLVWALTLLWTIRFLRHQPTASNFCLAAAMTIFAIVFVGRFSYDNYFSSIAWLLLAAATLEDTRSPSATT